MAGIGGNEHIVAVCESDQILQPAVYKNVEPPKCSTTLSLLARFLLGSETLFSDQGFGYPSLLIMSTYTNTLNGTSWEGTVQGIAMRWGSSGNDHVTKTAVTIGVPVN
jgi:hypothetical protein